MVNQVRNAPQGLAFSERATGFVTSTQKKQIYWTPDGRKLTLAPLMRGWVKRDAKGKEIESGIRDANLDKGYLLNKPIELKPYCPHCDQWHDTEKEIKECGRKRADFIKNVTRKAKKEVGLTGDGRLDKLEADMVEIKGLLLKLARDGLAKQAKGVK